MGGKGVLNEHGKYTKPIGWLPPDHVAVLEECDGLNLQAVSEEVMARKGQ